jgi:hypothetical protein
MGICDWGRGKGKGKGERGKGERGLVILRVIASPRHRVLALRVPRVPRVPVSLIPSPHSLIYLGCLCTLLKLTKGRL